MAESVQAPSSTGRSSVLLVSFHRRPRPRVHRYARRALSLGANLTVVVLDPTDWRELAEEPTVRLYVLPGAGRRPPWLVTLENRVVFRIPISMLAVAGRLSGDGRFGRIATRILGVLQRWHGRIAYHIDQISRPLLLAGLHRRLSDAELGGLDQIVAADQLAVPFACRLARRYPHAIATTALDVVPGHPGSGHSAESPTSPRPVLDRP